MVNEGLGVFRMVWKDLGQSWKGTGWPRTVLEVPGRYMTYFGGFRGFRGSRQVQAIWDVPGFGMAK